MNELKINVTEQKFDVVDLASCTKTINNLKALGNVSTLAIAKALFIIEDNGYLTNTKTTIYEYAKENFDYSRPTVSNMLRVARKFLTDDKYDLWTAYSYGALLEMCMLNYDDVIELVNSGEINPTMTVKEIRKLIKKICCEDAEDAEDVEYTREHIKTITLENLRLLISNFELDDDEKALVKAIVKGITML